MICSKRESQWSPINISGIIKLTHTLRANIGIDKFPVIIGKNISQELLAFLDAYNPKNIFLIIDSYFKNGNGKVY